MSEADKNIDWEAMDVSDIKLCKIDNPACESCAG
jgi:hypothetical protein